jgi:type II secretory pathway pseudopilin PulG
MTPPAPKPAPRNDESGFIIIEVLVSAIILALAAGAVLALITSTTRSAASGRNHGTAYGLAQEDQARLRTLRISTLNHLEQRREETIAGALYTIESEGIFVNNTSSSASCTESSNSADYIEIISTVSSPVLLRPVSLQSVVSPSSGSLDPSHGNIAFQALDSRNNPLAGVKINATGPANFSGETEAMGCANFTDLASGNYRVTIGANGLINPAGEETEIISSAGVPAGGTEQVTTRWDEAAKIEPEFVNYSPTSPTTTVLASIDSWELYNSASGKQATTVGTPGGTRGAAIAKSKVYPYANKYVVFGGSCENNNPDPEAKPTNLAGIGMLEVEPGSTWKPKVYVPTLSLTVSAGTPKVAGATVVITDNTANCSSPRRTYTTNSEGRQARVTTPVGTASTGPTEAGLPFGTYTICATAKISGTWRKISETGVKVQSVTTPTSLNLDLNSTKASTSSSELTC